MEPLHRRIFIVSNRLPVTVKRKKEGFVFTPSVGGLATGLKSIFEEKNCIWIGWPGLAVKSEAEEKQIVNKLRKLQMIPVFLSNQEIKKSYEGFCNVTIWPLFHYFLQYTEYHNDLWEVYQQVNQKFFDCLKSIITDNDIIWIHDYHLMLLPGIIRQKMPNSSIGYFLHIPFPSYELFRTLPWRAEILHGLLGADLIGFHTYDYARHFLSTVKHLLDIEYISNQLVFEQRLLKVDSFPMGIDYQLYTQGGQNSDVAKLIKKHRSGLNNCKVILSVDRLDYSKGILNRLRAFSILLENHTEYREKVTLFLIVVPSRVKVPQYQKIKQEIDREVGYINGRYSTIGWNPIHYFYRNFDFNYLVAFYHLA
ncbi:MAG: trehalose-6-phosphate synthase, partial [Candidatus Marinimicrobia bacterium]|nr:trehalose-6-phosphate synthase [Candidatus Neomarinimicrobiota bacterium]